MQLEAVQDWSTRNNMTINPIPEPDPLRIGSEVVERVKSHKLLGVWHQNNIKWSLHVESIVKKANKCLYSLRECRRPILEYAAPMWSGLPQYLIDEIESIQNRSMRKILGTPRDNFKTEQRRADLTIKELQKIQNDPTNPCNKFIPQP